jgi:DNA-binding response OmpR family regulator
MAKRILIVDDEPRYLRLLEANLRTEGYEVVTAADGAQAVDVFTNQPIDLVLMDVMMPKLDGFGATQRIREFSNTPIIILTAKGDEQDRVRGLDLGADDYLVKPFSATELLARVRAVLRRAQPTPEVGGQSRFFTHGSLKIDFARAEIWKGETPVSLSATEYRTDKEILWVSIARLRQKLEDDSHTPKHIVTRSGFGYLMPPIDE